ncbi:MAG: hypothetical protein JXN60_06200, partial [Lentisphaerae bacterium]|nr:hypothetical protein [Lentisphaerota bacterium]
NRLSYAPTFLKILFFLFSIPGDGTRLRQANLNLARLCLVYPPQADRNNQINNLEPAFGGQALTLSAAGGR